MTPFSALIGGGAGGLIGAALAQALVTLANRMGAENWLKGAYGPPFFDVALYMGILCAGAAAGSLRRLGPAVFGLAAPLAIIALPMGALTHWARWGMDAGGPPTYGWFYTVGALYIAATWGTIFGLGAWPLQARRWLGGLLACAGAFAGYLVLSLLLRLAPSFSQIAWSPTELLASPVNLLDGLLTGAGLSLGIYCARRIDEKSARS